MSYDRYFNIDGKAESQTAYGFFESNILDMILKHKDDAECTHLMND